MSMRLCCVLGCRNHVREGLQRFGKGTNGQPLADGRTCWRCRARQVDKRRSPRNAKDIINAAFRK